MEPEIHGQTDKRDLRRGCVVDSARHRWSLGLRARLWGLRSVQVLCAQPGRGFDQRIHHSSRGCPHVRTHILSYFVSRELTRRI